MTRKKNDTHRGTGRKLYPLKDEDSGMFKKIKQYQKEYEDEMAKQEIEEFKNAVPNRLVKKSTRS